MGAVTMALISLAASTDPAGGGVPGGVDITGLVSLVNYGVLGVLVVGSARGWVFWPKERERLTNELDSAKAELKEKDVEIARLNLVIQENLQATTATMDKQIELAIARSRAGGPISHGDST